MAIGRFRIANVAPQSAIAVILDFFNDILTLCSIEMDWPAEHNGLCYIGRGYYVEHQSIIFIFL